MNTNLLIKRRRAHERHKNEYYHKSCSSDSEENYQHVGERTDKQVNV